LSYRLKLYRGIDTAVSVANGAWEQGLLQNACHDFLPVLLNGTK